MKKILLAIVFLFIPILAYSAPGDTWTIQPTYPSLSRPLGEAGSYTNPYRATERWDGKIEIKPSYPDFNQRLGEPGSYTNPYLLEPRKKRY